MTTFEIASLAIAATSAGSAATAAAGIWYGIRAMVRANQVRVAALDQQRIALDQQRIADDQRHAESMAALSELIRRTGRAQ